MINVSILGCVLGLLLLAVPFYVMFKYRLRIMDVVLASLVRMVLTMGVVGGMVYAAIAYDKLWLNVVLTVMMIVAGAVLAVRRSRLNMRRLMVPMLAGMSVATLVVAAYVLYLVVGVESPLSAKMLLPVAGMLVAGVMTSNAKALHAYYVGLANHSQLYDYLVGNGATHRQAVNYFVRRALEANMVPHARYMAYTVVTVAPAMAWAMVMSGAGVVAAGVVTVMMAVAAMAASVLSLMVALMVGRKYCFDDYMALKKDVASHQSTNDNNNTQT